MWIIFIAAILILPVSICIIFSLILIGIKCFYYFRKNPYSLPIIYIQTYPTEVYNYADVNNISKNESRYNQDLPIAQQIY
jgi:hypothetical protein